MQGWNRRSWLSLAVITALVVVLLILAVLQYRWSGWVSEAEQARMSASLNTAVHQFRREFQLDLQRICTAFQFDPGSPLYGDPKSYVQRYDSWLLNASDTRLIQHLYLWEAAPESPLPLWQLFPEKHQFQPVPWPDHLEADRLRRSLIPMSRPPMGFRSYPWIFLEESLLLIHPLSSFDPRGGAHLRSARYLIIELDRQAMQQEIIPELAQRYFGGNEGFLYQIAIVGDPHQDNILYRSEPTLSPEFFKGPDIRTHLLMDPRDFFPRSPEGNPPDRDGPAPPAGINDRLQLPPLPSSPEFRPGRPRIPSAILFPGREESRWILLARHHGGTLAEVVAGQRHRNLAIGFGILLLLALSMAMIVLSTHRAQRLARLQMDFVAGVSHELRTPITVIRAAGDNLAAGIIADSSEQIRQYGELIRQEGMRLSAMVEQILQFVSAQAGYKKYHLLPTQVADILDSLLMKLQPMIDAAGFTVERQVETGLPMVGVDRTVLSQCLENLVSNAVKYGFANRWLGVRAASVPVRGGREVQIAVEDKGVGIDKTDLPNIFDPFYRGRAAAEAQIHGNGLGLFIAKEGVVAMGGRISVKSKPGAGSTFTLHLPALSSTEGTIDLQHEEKNTSSGR